MALDWFSRAGSSESVADLVARKKYDKALERLRAEFGKGNRSVGLRLQYAEVLAAADQADQAIPVLLGLASELHAAGATARAQEVLQQADKIGPGRAEVAAKRRAFKAWSAPSAAESVTTAPRRPDAPPPPPAGPGARAAPLGPLATDDESSNDAVDIFGPALAPPSLQTAAPSTAGDAPTGAEAALVSEVWVDVEGDASPEVLLAEIASEPSIADVAEMAVADGQGEKGSLVTYIRGLTARFPVPAGERPGLRHLAAALFEGLDDDALRALLPGLRRRDFDPGAAMVREGEQGGTFFVLARGRARVMVQGTHRRPFEVAEILEGAFFGEISLVGGHRMATVEAIGPCETLEVATSVIEALAPRRPLAQEIVEQALLERASSVEVEAVRAIPAMDEGAPARALAILDAHFGLEVRTPKLRLRLADLLARAGHYVDVVPLLVGIADQMQSAGQPARALAALGKITTLGVRASRELHIPTLTREPAKPRPGPPSAILTYVTQGHPVPTPKVAQQFRRWLQELMEDARSGEATAEGSGEDQAEAELVSALELDEAAADLGSKTAGEPQGATPGTVEASSLELARPSGLSSIS